MKNDHLETAVLFLIFNRPEQTEKVFEAIKNVRPSRLYIAADGPRAAKSGEQEKCELARGLVLRGIDWPCEVKTLFRTENAGCGKAVSSAISWFFSEVEEGIILEDDCLPDRSFFFFCQELLDKYRDNDRIAHIGGSNFQRKNYADRSSYYFSNYIHIWGWATWRRAWEGYELVLPAPEHHDIQLLRNRFPNQTELTVWTNNFNNVIRDAIDTWDTQWVYHIFKTGRLGITPVKNLVSNIGFGFEATHTHSYDELLAELPLQEIDSLVHPRSIKVLRKADQYTYKKFFRNGNTRFNRLKFETAKRLPFLKKIYLKFKRIARE